MVERPVRTVLAVIAALLVASVGACEFPYSTYTFRYRLTIEVEMPDGTARAESSVVGDLQLAFAALEPAAGHGPVDHHRRGHARWPRRRPPAGRALDWAVPVPNQLGREGTHFKRAGEP